MEEEGDWDTQYEGLALELLRCHLFIFFKVAKRQAGIDIRISPAFVQSVCKLLSSYFSLRNSSLMTTITRNHTSTGKYIYTRNSDYLNL